MNEQIRVVEIQHSTVGDIRTGIPHFNGSYTVMIQRGELRKDPDMEYSRRFHEFCVNEYSPVSRASLDRLSQIFDSFDGGSRPDNIETEFYISSTRMDLTFSVSGRLERS